MREDKEKEKVRMKKREIKAIRAERDGMRDKGEEGIGR